MQVPGRVHLRSQHRVHPLGGELLDGAVVEHAGRVHHGGERPFGGYAGQQFGERDPVGHVDRDHVDPRAHRGQLPDQFARAFGVRPSSTGQQQVPHAVLDQVSGDRPTQRAGAAGDQHGAGWVEPAGQGEHQFADVQCLAHVPERVRGVAQIPCGHRQRPEVATFEQAQQLAEHPGGQVSAGLPQVERAVAGTGPVPDLGRVADVGLAHLQEPPGIRQQPQ